MDIKAGVPCIKRNRGSSEIRRSASDENRVWKVSGVPCSLLMIANPPNATRMDNWVEAAASVDGN